MYVCMYVCICVSMYRCIDVCMYVCMYVCMCVVTQHLESSQFYQGSGRCGRRQGEGVPWFVHGLID